MYDINISNINKLNINFSFEKGLEIIKKGLAILGNDYIEIINKMFDEGWVDVYPKENKRTMSFTCISYVGVPYISINYNNSINSIRTLAHEIGHSINAYYSKTNNSFHNFEFSYFLTEIVAKVNEILVNEYMLNMYNNKPEKTYILDNIISNIINSLFNQTMLTEFEHTVINKLSINKNVDATELNNIYFNICKKYYGPSIDYDDNIKYNWSKIPHFIMQDTYYLYQYSIGICIAYNIAYRILKKENNIINKYKNLLSLGNSISIEQALKTIDIDLNNYQYIDDTINILKDKLKILRNSYE